MKNKNSSKLKGRNLKDKTLKLRGLTPAWKKNKSEIQ